MPRQRGVQPGIAVDACALPLRQEACQVGGSAHARSFEASQRSPHWPARVQFRISSPDRVPAAACTDSRPRQPSPYAIGPRTTIAAPHTGWQGPHVADSMQKQTSLRVPRGRSGLHPPNTDQDRVKRLNSGTTCGCTAHATLGCRLQAAVGRSNPHQHRALTGPMPRAGHGDVAESPVIANALAMLAKDPVFLRAALARGSSLGLDPMVCWTPSQPAGPPPPPPWQTFAWSSMQAAAARAGRSRARAPPRDRPALPWPCSTPFLCP